MNIDSVEYLESSLLRPSAPLGQLVWWSSTGALPPPSEWKGPWARASLPPGPDSLPLALENAVDTWLGVPLLGRAGVCWLAPRFAEQVETLREVLAAFPEWELHTVPLRATSDTLAALRASAERFLMVRLETFALGFEDQLTQPRTRASVLVRRLDALERLRQQGRLHAERLGLEQPGLGPQLDHWASRIDAVLCARIVA